MKLKDFCWSIVFMELKFGFFPIFLGALVFKPTSPSHYQANITCATLHTHTHGFMAPYRNKRYWLKDFRNGGPSRDPAEKFNHDHSQLRNVIERIFGMLKMRYPLLSEGIPSYSFTT